MPKTRQRVRRLRHVAEVCLFATLIVALVWQYTEFQSYRQGIFVRCVARVRYDQGANDGRTALIVYLRAQPGVPARQAVAALEQANQSVVSPDCAKVK